MNGVLKAASCALFLHAMALPVSAQTMLGQMFSGHGYVGGIRLDDLYQFEDGTSIEQLSGTLVGGQLGLGITPSVSIFGNAASTSTTMYLGAVEGQTFGEAFEHELLLWDVSIQVRKPFWHEELINPLVQLGAGQMRITTSPGWDSTLDDVRTTPLLSAGVGFDLQFGQSVGIRVMAKDYIASASWENTSDPSFNSAASTVPSHNLAYHVGFTFGF